jgi:hypothetical protein
MVASLPLVVARRSQHAPIVIHQQGAPDQQASCAKDLTVMVGLFAFEIGQFENQSCNRGPLVPAPADRRLQSDRRCVFAISSAVPTMAIGAFLGVRQRQPPCTVSDH